MAEEVSTPAITQKRKPRRDFSKLCLFLIVGFLAFGIILDGLVVLYMTANDCENMMCIKTVNTYTTTNVEGETVEHFDPVETEKDLKSPVGIVISVVIALDIMVAGLGFLVYQMVTNILLRRKFRTRLFIFYMLAFLAISGLIISYMYNRIHEPGKTIQIIAQSET